MLMIAQWQLGGSLIGCGNSSAAAPLVDWLFVSLKNGEKERERERERLFRVRKRKRQTAVGVSVYK